MLLIDNTEVSLNRGDQGKILVELEQNGEPITLLESDVVNMAIYSEENLDKDPLQKLNASINTEENVAEIIIEKNSTAFVPEDNMPFNYWYEVEWNGIVIIGYDKEGPKIFRVYPNGKGE